MKPPTSDKNLRIFHWVRRAFTEGEEELTPDEQTEQEALEGEEWDEYLQMIIAGEE